MKGKKILETTRLILRELNTHDASFFMEITNTEAWIQNIGDRKIHSIKDAEFYISLGPMKSYEENQFGIWLMESKADGEAIGMCGLVKRPGLENVDIGFALLPQYYKKGYAREAAEAVLKYGKEQLNLAKIVAICNPNNINSLNLLKKLGYQIDKKIMFTGNSEVYLLLPPS